MLIEKYLLGGCLVIIEAKLIIFGCVGNEIDTNMPATNGLVHTFFITLRPDGARVGGGFKHGGSAGGLSKCRGPSGGDASGLLSGAH